MKPTDMGKNRTGVAMSPKDSADMAKAARNAQVPPGDESGISGIRESYSQAGQAVGTMPPPASLKGAAKTAGKMLKGQKPTVLLDKLGERLAFERTGTRLYEAMISKMTAFGGGNGAGPDTQALREIQYQEMEHMQLLAEAIQKLGADPTAETPCADVAGVQSLGIMQVLTDPRTTISQCLGALLTAELVDNASWELLIDLCTQFGQDDMVREFGRAYQEEQMHLSKVRQWLSQSIQHEAMGAGASP